MTTTDRSLIWLAFWYVLAITAHRYLKAHY